MLLIIKHELVKIIKNRTILGGIIISGFILIGIFFVGYNYSQLNMSETNNEKKGFGKSLDTLIEKKYAGDFTDDKVKIILSDLMKDFQTNEKNKISNKPFYLFYWEFANTFFAEDAENIYSQMIESVKDGYYLTINDVKVNTISELGFKKFDRPLQLGNFLPWTVLYQVSGHVFLLLCIVIILVNSVIFSDDSSKNINQILFTTKYGRNKLIYGKLVAGVSVTISLFIVFHTLNFVTFSMLYDMNGWNASIQTNLGMNLFDFPIECNHLQIYFITLVIQLVEVLFVEGITLLISAFVRSTMSTLAISLGGYLLPKLLLQILRTGFINKILYLLPVNNIDIQKTFVILKDRNFIFSSFGTNMGTLVGGLLMLYVIMEWLCCKHMKNWRYI